MLFQPNSRPQNATVAKRLAKICQLEKMPVEMNALENIAAISNGDIRQAINMLYMWRRTKSSLNYNDTIGMRESKKDVEKNLWDLPSVFFRGPQSGKSNWVDERIEAYFFDTGILPLFIQEMYVNSIPNRNGSNTVIELEALASASELIAEATIIERQIQRNQDYSAAQFHGFLSCVMPGFTVGTGGGGTRIGFPAYEFFYNNK